MSSTTPEARRLAAAETPFGGSAATLDQAPVADAVDPGFDSTAEDARAKAVRHALQLWLKWNSAHEKLAAKMFKVGHNSAMMEDLIDQIDQLRTEAVSVSEQLIDY